MSTTPPIPEPITIAIGDRTVGDRQPVQIIAEGGVNHDGELDKALHLVDIAAEAGADFIKFQMFHAAELATAEADAAAYQRAGGVRSQREMLQQLELSDADFQKIREYCDERRITFLATPFSPHDVDRLIALNVQAIKIASTDLNNVPLMRRAVDTGLPLLVSTGASTAEEISAAVERLRSWQAADRVILMHCISGYPAPLETSNLRAIRMLRDTFNMPCGFSDHTDSTRIAGWAVAAGACVLEKHVTLDPHAAGPDHAMSLSPTRLRAYVAATREAEKVMGTGRIGMTPVEADVRAVARKSVVAAADIAAGTTLTPDLLAVKRPSGGIPPDQFDEVIGRRVKQDISTDAPLTWDLLE